MKKLLLGLLLVFAVSCGGPTSHKVESITMMGQTRPPQNVEILVIYDGDTVSVIGYKGQTITLVETIEGKYEGVFEGFPVIGSKGVDDKSFSMTMDTGFLKIPVKLNY